MNQERREAMDIEKANILSCNLPEMLEMLYSSLALAKKCFEIVIESDNKRGLALCAMLARHAHFAAHASLARIILEEDGDLGSHGKEVQDEIKNKLRENPEWEKYKALFEHESVFSSTKVMSVSLKDQKIAKQKATDLIDKITQDHLAEVE